jgi:hypothetical protein
MLPFLSPEGPDAGLTESQARDIIRRADLTLEAIAGVPSTPTVTFKPQNVFDLISRRRPAGELHAVERPPDLRVLQRRWRTPAQRRSPSPDLQGSPLVRSGRCSEARPGGALVNPHTRYEIPVYRVPSRHCAVLRRACRRRSDRHHLPRSHAGRAADLARPVFREDAESRSPTFTLPSSAKSMRTTPSCRQ